MPTRANSELAEKARNLARDECRAIARALAVRRRIHPAIHDARKAIRRLRALLALVETRLPAASAIDRQLERMGDGLSALRDAHVVVEVARHHALHHRKRWAESIQRLEARRDVLLERVLARDPGFLRRRALLTRLEARLEFLDWASLRVPDLAEALEKSQLRVENAERRAAHQDLPENLHRWRRRVRRLRFQLDSVAYVAPATLRKLSRKHPGKDPKALHRLGDQLGARRDEQMLAIALLRLRGLEGRREMLEQMHAVKRAPPKPMPPRDYPAPLLSPPEAERDIVG